MAVSQGVAQAGQWGRPGPGWLTGLPGPLGLPSVSPPPHSWSFFFLSPLPSCPRPLPLSCSVLFANRHMVYFRSWPGAWLGSSAGLRLDLQRHLLEREHGVFTTSYPPDPPASCPPKMSLLGLAQEWGFCAGPGCGPGMRHLACLPSEGGTSGSVRPRTGCQGRSRSCLVPMVQLCCPAEKHEPLPRTRSLSSGHLPVAGLVTSLSLCFC